MSCDKCDVIWELCRLSCDKCDVICRALSILEVLSSDLCRYTGGFVKCRRAAYRIPLQKQLFEVRYVRVVTNFARIALTGFRCEALLFAYHPAFIANRPRRPVNLKHLTCVCHCRYAAYHCIDGVCHCRYAAYHCRDGVCHCRYAAYHLKRRRLSLQIGR